MFRMPRSCDGGVPLRLMDRFATSQGWTPSEATDAVVLSQRHVALIAALVCIPLPLFSFGAMVLPLPQLLERAAVTFAALAAPSSRDGRVIREPATGGALEIRYGDRETAPAARPFASTEAVVEKKRRGRARKRTGPERAAPATVRPTRTQAATPLVPAPAPEPAQEPAPTPSPEPPTPSPPAREHPAASTAPTPPAPQPQPGNRPATGSQSGGKSESGNGATDTSGNGQQPGGGGAGGDNDPATSQAGTGGTGKPAEPPGAGSGNGSPPPAPPQNGHSTSPPGQGRK